MTAEPGMVSTMQDDAPLNIPAIIGHVESLHGAVELRVFDGNEVRGTTYADVVDRVHRLTGALKGAGIRPGDRVGTFLWNTQPHVEVYFGVPAAGAVVHTLNIRLFPDQVAKIIDHAQDRVLIVDATLWDQLAPLLAARSSVDLVIVTGDLDPEVAAESVGTGARVVAYEEFLADAKPVRGQVPDERAPAGMCYTSGTTGDPKGVVYSHRALYLHAMVNLTAAGFGIGEDDSVLQVVPLFHANGWGFPHAAWLGGARLILPDRYLQPETLTPLIAAERPTVSGGVPTVWRGVYDHAQEHGLDITSLRVISCAGSAVPQTLLEDYVGLGIQMYQAWGMTETAPLAAIARPPTVDRGRDEWYWRTRTGRPVPGVEVRAVGEDGTVLPRDGSSVGELEVRGPWVTGSYAGGVGDDRFDDGWLRTGDMGHLDDAGAMKITDRSKDLIKSGGEWISSTELEDHISAHPSVVEVAVIAIPDPKWEERPLALVRLHPGTELTGGELRAHLLERLPRWQVPDSWSLVEEIAKTGVGKFDKEKLRDQYADGELTTEPMT